jgi:hypothetical protein
MNTNRVPWRSASVADPAIGIRTFAEAGRRVFLRELHSKKGMTGHDGKG